MTFHLKIISKTWLKFGNPLYKKLTFSKVPLVLHFPLSNVRLYFDSYRDPAEVLVSAAEVYRARAQANVYSYNLYATSAFSLGLANCLRAAKFEKLTLLVSSLCFCSVLAVFESRCEISLPSWEKSFKKKISENVRKVRKQIKTLWGL